MIKIKEKSGIIVLALYLIATVFLQLTSSALYAKYINPIFWALIAVYWLFIHRKSYQRFNRQKIFMTKMMLLVIIYLMLMFYTGLITGYGANPYSQSLLSILKNCIQILVPIIGIEITRSWLLNANRNNKWIIVAVTILLILVEVDYAYFFNNITDKRVMFEYASSTLAPLLLGNILFSYLVILGSYKLSLIYRIADQLLLLLSPIIPNMDWFVTGAFKLISITIIFYLFKYRYYLDDDIGDDRKDKQKHRYAYPITIFFSILLILFMLGVFKYEPITILSNSMVPTYSRGDVLIYEKFSEEELKELKVGQIIVFRTENINIAHRINKVIKQGDSVVYETKGDNNTSADLGLVDPEQIIGVYIGSVSYLGYPSVWLDELLR